jgi:hypothetical protein
MTLCEGVEREVNEHDPWPVRASEEELQAWENQCDPRLPQCLAGAVDRLGHLRECRKCQQRDDW